MDVSKIGNFARVQRGFAQYAAQAKNTKNAKSTEEEIPPTHVPPKEMKLGSAFEVDISDAAKKVQQTTKQDDLSVENEGTEKTKGLSAEQVDKLNEDLAMQESTMINVMIQAMTESTDKLQGWLDEGVGMLNFGGTKIDAALFGMPEVATNAEDAAKAIAPGGAWSVDAVSTRILDLATAIAGNDPERLSQMRAAVEDGFKQAGVAWKDMTGQDNMPEITKQTYNEIMSRFDKRAEELNGASGASLGE